MLTSYVYAIWGSERMMVLALPEEEDIPPLRVMLGAEEWTRISDTVLTCESALHPTSKKGGHGELVMTKCGGGWECHRTILGKCMCGLHSVVRLRADQT